MCEGPAFVNMCQLLDFLENRDRERRIFSYMSGAEVREISGDAFFAHVRKWAGQLNAMGLNGCHIGLMGRNRWQWMAALCAVFQAGGIAVLLSPELNQEELAEAICRADIRCVLCDEDIDCLKGAYPVPVVSLDEEPAGAEDFSPVQAAGSDPACILFTSGTTGEPKAAVFSHSALLAGICHNVIGFPFRSQLAILPMHHIAGFASVLNTWYLGREICLGEEVKNLYRYLRRMQPDYVLTVPAVLQAIVKKLSNAGEHGNKIGWDLHLLGCGGAAFPREVLERLNSHKIRVLQSYGATEAGGIGFDWEMTPACGNSIGKPCAEMEVRIRDGQLFLRSPSMMSGYYKDPEGTAQVLQDGWYATGDLCEQDEKGYLYLKGRLKNLIILSNGENVSPEEIERKILASGLAEEAMVGLWENQITLWIYPKKGALEETVMDLVDQYNASVSRSRQIVNVQILAEPFAKTETGKQIRGSVTGGTGK